VNNTEINAERARDFSVAIVRKLREAGYEAYWAGGCVRDLLRGTPPKDYDVATNAHPGAIRDLFSLRRTLAIGAAFGVIIVVGPPDSGNVEVATFREDANYSDGRRPDAVRFSTAQQDAQRRDFTVNGMFYDPLDSIVLDWVGGQEDLRRRIVRAIGDPHERIAEDKLRMLRAIRFATVLEFDLDHATEQAIATHCSELYAVSAERVTAELERILIHPCRSRGIELLRKCQLLSVVLPTLGGGANESADWRISLELLRNWSDPIDVRLALAALHFAPTPDRGESDRCLVELEQRLRWPRHVVPDTAWLLASQRELGRAGAATWPHVQRLLADPRGRLLFMLAEGVSQVTGQGAESLDFCREQLRHPDWNPPPLLSGRDLQSLGIPPGPSYRALLERVRDAQLMGRITSHAEAIDQVRAWHHALTRDDGTDS
jgi:poly(A) polymerase